MSNFKKMNVFTHKIWGEMIGNIDNAILILGRSYDPES
tara:strand:+ start:399987 stop:400100 length:114 start_codon:yes stop_codon:yes gene_type:complete